MKNTSHNYFKQSIKYMTASLLLMPFTGVFGVLCFLTDWGVDFLMYLLLFVLFGTFTGVFFDNAIRLLSQSEKQSKKIYHKLYDSEEDWKNIDKYS